MEALFYCPKKTDCMKTGKYKLSLIEAGRLSLDGGAMFGVIPKALWSKANIPDEKNRIPINTRCLLAESDSRKILVDTGTGTGWNDKFNEIYGIDQSDFEIFGSLKNAGVNPDEITDVILTHLHFDHTGGTVIFRNGKPEPAFPNAKYYVQKKQYDWACDPTERDKASYFPERFVTLADAGVLNFFDGDTQFDDEITLKIINGHTFAQQMILFSDASQNILYAADFLPTVSHIPVPYVAGYDLQPLITIMEKKAILPVAVKEEWKIIFEHDSRTAAGTITENEKGFALKKKFNGLDDE